MAPVVAATRSWRNRLQRLDDEEGAVPLWPNAPARPMDRPELDVLVALATTLAQRPGLRPVLARRDVGARLVAEMAEGMRLSLRPGARLGPRTRTVLLALDQLGYHHPIGGRPLPGDRLPDAATLVDAVLARLPAGHYTVPVVAGIARRFYLDVAPWPFTALVDPGDLPRLDPDGPDTPAEP